MPFHHLLTKFSLVTINIALGLGVFAVKPSHAFTFSNVTIDRFTGGDIGEGLDLDGNFIYAVNVSGPAVGAIRDANFTADSVDGVTVTAQVALSSFVNPDYGNTVNDDRLETVMQSIRFSYEPGTVDVDLANLVIGKAYKAQLLFAESFYLRGFDIFAEGTKIANRFSPGQIQGLNGGAFVSFEFTAADDILNIVLAQSTPGFVDNNPIINGFTLEEIEAVPTPALLPGLIGFGAAAFRKRQSRQSDAEA